MWFLLSDTWKMNLLNFTCLPQLHKYHQTLLVLFNPVQCMNSTNLEWFKLSVSNIWDLDAAKARWLKAKVCVGKFESVENEWCWAFPYKTSTALDITQQEPPCFESMINITGFTHSKLKDTNYSGCLFTFLKQDTECCNYSWITSYYILYKNAWRVLQDGWRLVEMMLI